MSELLKKLGIDEFSVEQRLALIEEIWASIHAEDVEDLWEIEELVALSRGRH